MQAGESVDLIDVRTPQEYNAGHVRCAPLLPLGRLTKEGVHPKFSGACQNGSV